MMDFKLSDDFVDTYRTKTVPWGYEDGAGNALGEITYLRTYSRKDPATGVKETWADTCRRVIEGMFTIQKRHCRQNHIEWKNDKAQRTAKDAFDRMFNMKWLPAGRGLWAMGTQLVLDEGNSAPLQSCAFASTSASVIDAMTFLFDASMLGVGVGFDASGAGKFEVFTPEVEGGYVIADSREGWVDSLRQLLSAYLEPHRRPTLPEFDYSLIRPEGAPIKRFGGVASGPDPLRRMHALIKEILDNRVGAALTMTDIADIGNIIGTCVVAGNVRRSAEIFFVDNNSNDLDDFVQLKNYEKNPDRAAWGWMSNNSVRVNVGDDFSKLESGIMLNGEPGLAWMDVVRKYGRLADAPDYKDSRAVGFNPCNEQPLENYETCVSGDTLIPTRTGTYKISDLVGQEVEIWNGEKWAPVTPRNTGRNSLIRVHLSDGSYLDATPEHSWSVKRKTEETFKKRTTNELEIGMYLPEFDLSAELEGELDPLAYTYGWIAGDGFVDGHKAVAIVRTDHTDDVLPKLEVKAVYPEQNFCNGSLKSYNRVVVDMDFEDARTLRQDDRLPQRVMEFSPASLREFFVAWVDTDGSVVRQANTDNYVIYGSEGMLRQAQVLLRRIGVNHASLQVVGAKGDETNYGVRNKDLYRLYIPSFESAQITPAYKKADRIGDRYAQNNAHPDGAKVDRARKQKIVAMELVSEDADTFCFTEPERHMGVFGNVLTYQCNLVEVFINNCEDRDDFIKTLKVAYLYGKTVTLLPTKWERTNTVMQRNRRIGLSASGAADFVDTHGMAELRDMLDDGYKYVIKLDNKYSEWLCVRDSIRHTTMKPSGSISIVAGSSPGTHWTPGGEYFIRRITFSKNDPLFGRLKAAGYTHEDLEHDQNSAVILFPIHSKSKRSSSHVPAWEKIHLASEIQAWWSDNAVSCTVDFKPEEAKDIPTLLAMYDGKLKGISFLPAVEGGAYKHMPYEEIDQQMFEIMSAAITKADFSVAYSDGEEAIGEKYCATDYCEVEEEVNLTEGEEIFSVPEIDLASV